MTLVQRIAEFARDAAIPDEILAVANEHVLDTLGVALGAVPLETSRAVIEHARELGGAQQAHAIGIEQTLPAPSAAFVNGVLAHSLDYDDTHLPSIVHPSASVVPATLAAAELAGANGAQTLRAIAVGLEVCARLGMAGYDAESRQSLYFERGQHATSICGAIAGAASAAMLLAPERVADAMGIAVSMGAGVIEGNRTGGTVKRLHCGIAAQSAVSAAMLARRGITGPPTALEGRFGFFQAFIDGRFDEEAITGGLGAQWEIARIFFKPYPANHFTHAGIDAAIALRARIENLDDIARIDLGVASPTVRTIGEPIEAKRAPETGYQAQFSGPYTVAAALFGGGGLGLGLDDFTDELARDPARRALMRKVNVAADAACDAIYPDQFPAVLTIALRNGDTITERVEQNRGGAARPLTAQELRAKFRDNALRSLPEDAVAQLERSFSDLGRADSIGEALAPTQAAK
jgi:2-methylcitrate dehydratase PrpD